MYEPPPGRMTVFKTKQRDECMESRLVLQSVGISSTASHHNGWWLLVVSGEDFAIAAEELDSYRRENLERSSETITTIPLYGGAAAAVYVYAGIIILVAILSAGRTFGVDWLRVGQMQAGRVMAGQWWRVVTALTLHVDVGHIASNLVFGAVFGLLAGRVLGGGVAWLAIVIAAALGNFMNAMVQAADHSSIGASTAVFAALGVVVSHALRPRTTSQETTFRRWSPLIGGVVLLAFTGVGGERTDVAAHVTGFMAGLLIGWLGCSLPNRWLSHRGVQTWSGLVAIAIVIAAWSVGLVIAG